MFVCPQVSNRCFKAAWSNLQSCLLFFTSGSQSAAFTIRHLVRHVSTEINARMAKQEQSDKRVNIMQRKSSKTIKQSSWCLLGKHLTFFYIPVRIINVVLLENLIIYTYLIQDDVLNIILLYTGTIFYVYEPRNLCSRNLNALNALSLFWHFGFHAITVLWPWLSYAVKTGKSPAPSAALHWTLKMTQ